MQKNNYFMIGNRFTELYEALSTSQRWFADQIGYSQGTLSRVESGKIHLTGKMKRAISRRYPEINLVWLETGSGPMFRDVGPATPGGQGDDSVKEQGPQYIGAIAGHKVTEEEHDLLVKVLKVIQGKWNGKFEVSLYQNIESFYSGAMAEIGKEYKPKIEGLPPPSGAKRGKHRAGGN